MTISRISSDLYSQNIFDKKRTSNKLEEKSNSTDKIELSQRAKDLHKAQVDNRFEEINQRIESSFYSQREVTEKIAGSILKEFEKNKEI